MSDCDLAKPNREELRKKLKNLVYATDESNYTQLRAEVFKLANKEFTDYFEKNW